MIRRDAACKPCRTANVRSTTQRTLLPKGGGKSLLGSDLEPRPYPNAKKSPEMAMFL
uniref:Uncharacterized protein n=2 Tax=unclassified Caudoviricetes TaxID=2788787 RepID=A0A8S5P938_9CAUD|nr:MAG TPA: hypothetical protein [Siphoviridae sp. ctPat53]DAE10401.1 MAG TPA: hypothetical protein [Siphoviridae sp. ct7cV26]